MNDKFGAFLLGGAVGAIVALLCAPRTGVETRAAVADRLNTAWNGAQDFGEKAGAQTQQVYQNVTARGQEFAQTAAANAQEFAQTAAARGQEFAQAATERGQEFAQAAAARVQQAAGNMKAASASLNSDELREKIEAARQRIASQVVRNAEESHDAVVDTIDVDAAVTDASAAAAPESPEAASGAKA